MQHPLLTPPFQGGGTDFPLWGGAGVGFVALQSQITTLREREVFSKMPLHDSGRHFCYSVCRCVNEFTADRSRLLYDLFVRNVKPSIANRALIGLNVIWEFAV